jgi:hypothetical protein
LEDLVYGKVNAAWKQTCKVLLGEEIGELKDYEEWLSRYMSYPMNSRPSALSGKPVNYSVPNYPRSAKLLSLDEVDFNKKFEPLNINEIKDMDSIVGALQERIFYTGNVILENSKFVAESSTISNSFNVFHSNFIDDSKYVAYCTQVLEAENMYGVNGAGSPKYIISAINVGKCTCCFSSNSINECSNLYYTHFAENCMDAMFCFGIRSKRNVIGNLELPPEKYKVLKGKLLEDINEELKKKKHILSVLELPTEGKLPELPKLTFEREEGDKAPIEEAFGKVTSVVLGRRLRNMDDYGDWLMQFVKKVHSHPSAISGQPVYFCKFYPYTEMAPNRFVTQKEAIELAGKLKLTEEELHSLESIKKSLWKIVFFSPQGRFMKNSNVPETVITRFASNCYHGGLYVFNDYCGFSYWSANSKYIFGSESALGSQSCIHAYHSVDLARCFEVDSCSTSTDLYFSHNCENVNDSMFTFNAKNLRYAVGNVQYPKEEYRKLRTTLLEQITDELEKKKAVPWNIYSLSGK